MAHNYSDICEGEDLQMLQDADNAITECNLWDWLKDYTPDENKGFMFSTHENLDKIEAAMKFNGDSNFLFAWTMRQMEYIAKNGWDKFYVLMNAQNVPACPCRKDKGFKFGWCGVAGGGVPGCDH